MIDGAPRTVAVGSTVQGVKLHRRERQRGRGRGRRQARHAAAWAGRRSTSASAASAGGGSQIVLTAGSGGHFFTDGSINGKAVRFIVDTGATHISISQNEAERIGLDYRTRPARHRATPPTARWWCTGCTLELGARRRRQVYNVEAVVLPAPMDQVLLGNSFLTRFQMKRENDDAHARQALLSRQLPAQRGDTMDLNFTPDEQAFRARSAPGWPRTCPRTSATRCTTPCT